MGLQVQMFQERPEREVCPPDKSCMLDIRSTRFVKNLCTTPRRKEVLLGPPIWDG